MGNSYTRMYLQLVFAVQNRQSLISRQWKEELYMYTTGIVQNQGHKMLAINGPANHIHIFIDYKPHQKICDLLKEIKGSSSAWINEHQLVRGHFNWQAGYGAFSYAHWDIDKIITYIHNQEEHHRSRNFKDEYMKLLQEFDIEYDGKYLLEDII